MTNSAGQNLLERHKTKRPSQTRVLQELRLDHENPSTRLKNMNRITLLNQQRQMFNYIAAQGNKVVGFASATPPRASKYSNEATKEIFLKDMDWTSDKVYKGCFVRATVITRPMKMASYITILEMTKVNPFEIL
jgi:hypothetical protein